MKRNLRILDRVQVKSPCTEDWNEMVGNGEVRFCSHCSQHVHNLSAMTRREAEALVLKSNGNLCIRYLRRPEDQQIVTLPDWMDRPALRRIVLPVAAGVMAMVLNTVPSLAQNSPLAKPAIQITDPARGKSSFQAAELEGGIRLEGVIKDPSGAFLPGVTVTCTNSVTKESLVTTSDEKGYFRLGFLVGGEFTIRYERPGFLVAEFSVWGGNRGEEITLQPDTGQITFCPAGEIIIEKNNDLEEGTNSLGDSDELFHSKAFIPEMVTPLIQSERNQEVLQSRGNDPLSLSVRQPLPAFDVTNQRTGVYGTVQDPTGAVITGAQVTLTNLETNQSQSTQSAETGWFQIEGIQNGIYRLSVKVKGFVTTGIESLELKFDQGKEINPVLQAMGEMGGFIITTDSLIDTETQAELQTEMALDETKIQSIFLQQVEAGDKSAVLGLLKQGMSPDARNEFGETALMLVGSSKTIAKYLVRNGADVNARNQVGTTPLMYAMLQEKTFIPKLLIAGGADVNAADQWGRTALMIAAFEGKTKFIKLLIAAGAETEVRDQFGKTARDYARDAEQKEAAKILMEELYKKWLSEDVSILVSAEDHNR